MIEVSKKRRNVLWIISIIMLGATLVLMWEVHKNVPFMMDDNWYQTLLYSDEPIKDFSDIVKAQIWHYNNWGGRSMTHTILQLTLLAGDTFANVMNIIMTFVTSIIIIFMSEKLTGTERTAAERMMAIVITVGLLHGLNANWKMSMYWQAGSANYLYITVFILLFIWCYLREIPCSDVQTDIGTSATIHAEKTFSSRKTLFGIYVWIIPLAILSGWSNENMGPVCFLISIAVMIFVKLDKRKIKAWMIEGACFSLAGSVACIIAPGNSVRSAEIESNSYGIIWQTYLRDYSIAQGALVYLFPSLLMTAAVIGIYFAGSKLKMNKMLLILLAAALLSWGAMVLSPHYPDRASYGTMVLLILTCEIMIRKIIKADIKWSLYFYIGGGIIWLRGMYYLEEFMGIVRGWIK